MEDKAAAEMLRQAYIDDVMVYETYDECQIEGPHQVCSDGATLVRRCKQIDDGLKMGRLQLGDK